LDNAEFSASNRFRNELSYLRDNIIAAITEGRVRAVEDGLQVYHDLAEAVIYVAGEAEARLPSLPPNDDPLALATFGRPSMPEMDWIKRDLVDLVEAAAKAGNRSVVIDVWNVPIDLADVALAARDPQSVQGLLGMLQYAYQASSDIADERVQDIAVNRIALRLQEFANYHVRRGLDAAEPKDRDAFIGAALAVFTTYSRLLKAAYDAKRLSDFQAIAGSLREAFYDLDDRVAETQRYIWEANLSRPVEAEQRPDLVEGAIEWQTLALYKRAALIGVTAWILNKEHARADLDPVASWTNVGEHARNAEDAYQTFKACNAIENVFGWDWWITEDQMERHGVTTRVAFSSYSFSEVLALWLAVDLVRLATTTIRSDLDVSEEDEYYLSEDGPLSRWLHAIESGAESWIPITGDDVGGRVARVREWLSQVRATYAEQQVVLLLQAPLSERRIAEVKAQMFEEWEKDGAARSLVRRLGAYEEVDDEEITEFGIAHFLPKQFFVDRRSTSVSMIGSDFARGLAHGEDEAFAAALLSAAEEVEVTDPASLGDEAISLASALVSQGLAPVILLGGYSATYVAVSSQPSFVPVHERGPGGKVGEVAGFSVFRLTSSLDELVFVVDVPAAIAWQQRPYPASEDVTPGRLLRFEVQAFDEVQALDYVRAHPALTFDEGVDAEADRAAALRTFVKVEAYERFRLLPKPQVVVKALRAGIQTVTETD
jgi:hypothetical protein